jgi:hypothetical protein
LQFLPQIFFHLTVKGDSEMQKDQKKHPQAKKDEKNPQQREQKTEPKQPKGRMPEPAEKPAQKKSGK